METTAPRTWKLFDRTVAPKRPVNITERDIQVLQHLHRHRFLTSDHLVALLEGGDQGIRARLKLLWREGFIDRPIVQVERYKAGGGSRPKVYAIGNKGSDLLYEVMGTPRVSNDWTAKNRELKQRFLEHALKTADFIIGIELATRNTPNVELIRFEEILADSPEATRKRRNPAGWSIEVPHNNKSYKTNVYPDAIFGLRFLDAPAGRDRAFFFVEVDRATMPVMRSDFRQTSFHGKLLAYYHSWQSWKADKKKAPFGFVNARILSLTTSAQRVEHFIKAGQDVAGQGKGLGLFLFADFPTLNSSDDVFQMQWVTAKGNKVSLLD